MQLTFKNNGNQVEINLYIDGTCNQSIVTGSSINYVSGNFNATIGALGSAPDDSSTAGLGYAKLSGFC